MSMIFYIVLLDATEIINISMKLWMNYNFTGYLDSVRHTYKPSGGNWTNILWMVKISLYNEYVSDLSSKILYYFTAKFTNYSFLIGGTKKPFTTNESIPFDTSVDTISPYERDASLLTITANGVPCLDDITLWYYWRDSGNSDTSSPWNWKFDFSIGEGYYKFLVYEHIMVIKDTHRSNYARYYQDSN